ncbi:MAG: ABC transporter permease, partial [Clostridiales bacterium]|nr:ABC transporter permease [Clostridiales bacterium]
TFFLMQMMPGDPFIGPKARSKEVMAAVYAKYGLDKPVWQQYLVFIGNLLHGDLGASMYYTGRNVSDIILEAFPYSFELGLRALAFAITGGLLLGAIAGIKRGTRWDTGTTIIAIIGISVPSFIIGYLLQYGISIALSNLFKAWFGMPRQWTLLPLAGWKTETSKILPSFALGLGSLATISRLMRTSILDVTNQDYIATAKSKGLSQRQITVRHTLRNAILPVITVLGPMAAAILTGAFIVENIFAIPGMGKFFVISVQNQDYTMITGTTIFYGAFLVAATTIVDIVYGLVDPRIRLT